VEQEKTHEIDQQNGPNEETERRKAKRFIRKRSAVAIALSRFFQILTTLRLARSAQG